MTHLSRAIRRVSLALAVGVLVAVASAYAQTPAQTPTAAYLGYRAALLKAKTLDQIRPHLAQAAIKMMDSMPAAERPMMFEMIRDLSSAVTNVKVVKETVTGDRATLEVTATDTGDKSTKKATVDVVREAGVWKFAKESWGG